MERAQSVCVSFFIANLYTCHTIAWSTSEVPVTKKQFSYAISAVNERTRCTHKCLNQIEGQRVPFMNWMWSTYARYRTPAFFIRIHVSLCPSAQLLPVCTVFIPFVCIAVSHSICEFPVEVVFRLVDLMIKWSEKKITRERTCVLYRMRQVRVMSSTTYDVKPSTSNQYPSMRRIRISTISA